MSTRSHVWLFRKTHGNTRKHQQQCPRKPPTAQNICLNRGGMHCNVVFFFFRKCAFATDVWGDDIVKRRNRTDNQLFLHTAHMLCYSLEIFFALLPHEWKRNIETESENHTPRNVHKFLFVFFNNNSVFIGTHVHRHGTPCAHNL